MQDKDGITHINIYSKGKTLLGRFLSNWYDWPINIPNWGNFRSIEGLIFYLGSNDEHLRVLSGYDAKLYGNSVENTDTFLDQDEFESIIREAIRIKILSHKTAKEELKRSTLPFKHYYVYKNKVVHAKRKWDFIIDEIELIRKELKEYICY
jgi:ribosomal protein L25 (general stress protein Ctc)